MYARNRWFQTPMIGAFYVVALVCLTACEKAPPVVSENRNFGIGCASARAGVAQSDIGCGLLPSSGIAVVDAAVAQDISIMRQFFAVAPAFSFFDECERQYRNALASPQGYILFGRYLAAELGSSGSTLPVIAILAHEFAHIHQYANGWFSQGPTAREFELEADAFAGFYGALQKAWAGEDLNAYYMALFAAGDFNFNHPGHHGTPIQRLAAGGVGLLAALITVQQGITPTPAQLHAFFNDRIRNCIVQVQDPSVCLNPGSADMRDGNRDPVVELFIASADSELIMGIAQGRRSLSEVPRSIDAPLNLSRGLYR